MQLEHHGGMCCGCTHIFNFLRQNSDGVREFKRELAGVLDFNDYPHVNGFEVSKNDDIWNIEASDGKFSCLVEAQLTDEQMMFWAPHLKGAGFYIVDRYLNSNSGNVVNVLHYNPAGRRPLPPVPYKW